MRPEFTFNNTSLLFLVDALFDAIRDAFLSGVVSLQTTGDLGIIVGGGWMGGVCRPAQFGSMALTWDL